LKKVTSLIMMLICISVLLAGCVKTKASDKSLSFSFNKNEYYTGFSDLPSKLTLEKAKEDGYFTIKDEEIFANKEVWDKFDKVSSRKENTSIRIAFFSEFEPKGPAYLDLYYKDGSYYMFNSTKKNEQKKPYEYLLTLDGRMPSAAVTETYFVLANDNTWTFEKLSNIVFSSNREKLKSLSEIRFFHVIHKK